MSQDITNGRFKVSYTRDNPLEQKLHQYTVNSVVNIPFTPASSDIVVNSNSSVNYIGIVDLSMVCVVHPYIPVKGQVLLGYIPASYSHNTQIYVRSDVTDPVVNTIGTIIGTDGSITLDADGDYGAPEPATVQLHATFLSKSVTAR